MKRTIFQTVATLVWLLLGIVLYLNWAALIAYANSLDSTAGVPGFYMLLGLGAFLLVVVHAWLSDVLAPPKPAAQRQPTAAERRAVNERAANEALKKGNKALAQELFEAAGMFVQAAAIAQELGDKPSLLRLSLRAGHYERAVRMCLEMKDYEGAAQASALMGEMGQAREMYLQAALEREAGGAPPRELAPLYDRAGDWERAVGLYEEASELERAAELHELLGNAAQARRLGDQAKTMRAFEKRQGFIDRDSTAYKEDMAKSAKIHEEMGDFLGAGFMYRDAGLLMEPALAFERAEEWERAAKAYDAAGQRDRAALARSRITRVPKKQGDEEGAGQGPADAPAPAAAPVPEFRPVMAQAQFIPVHMPRAKSSVDVLEAQERMAQRIRRGEYLEAAAFAEDAQDWLMAAALYERGGDMLRAADLYRQVGKNKDAAFCLEKAGRAREAALLCLAQGDDDGAIQILNQAMEQKPDAQLGLLLGEIHARRGENSQAMNLLRKRIAPDGIGMENADTFYRFGRVFENAGALTDALGIYRELYLAGAEGGDLDQRIEDLSHKLGRPTDSPKSAVEELRDSVTSLPTETRIMSPLAGKAPVINAPAAPDGFGVTMAPLGGGQGVPELSLFGEPMDEAAEAARAAGADPFASGRRYDFVKELARGGMGVVYEARDTALDRVVALKLIQERFSRPESVQQFLLEARAVARISHPNIVVLYDIGLMDLKHYITMEIVRGGSLERLIEKEGRLQLNAALRLFVEMARALRVAHEAGVVHRDIKPGNILLNERREVKIVDFGLAKLHQAAGEGEEMEGKTIFSAAGTPGYMAPEQIRGEESRPRADIYALGIVLFYMLAGVPPHRAAGRTGNMKILAFQLDGKLPSLKEQVPGLPDHIEQLYRYCTALDPDERYQGVDAFLPAAEEWLAASTAPKRAAAAPAAVA